MRCCVLMVESGQLSARLFHGDIRPEPPEDVQVGAETPRLHRHGRPLERPGDPHIQTAVLGRKSEARRQDADDGVGRARQGCSTAEDGGIAAEVATPQAGADDGDIGGRRCDPPLAGKSGP
jgi:hypothetical protein